MAAVPSPTDLFGAGSPTETAERFESFKSALAESKARTDSHQFRPSGRFEGYEPAGPDADTVKAAGSALAEIDTIEKTASAEVLASIRPQLDAQRAALAEMTKDFTSSSPLSTGFVPFDLEAPAKLLLPRQTPLRNALPRTKGVGSARRFKRILGVSNLGVGGVPNQSIFFNSESTTNTFGGVSGLRRPNKIAYAADEKVVSYVEAGQSDSLTWRAQYQGTGFQDLRSLSQTSVLWAHLHGEERALLYGRGTLTGFAGALAAPSGVTGVAAAGGSLSSGTVYIKVTAVGGNGESVPSSEVSVSVTANQQVTVTVGTEPTGATGYNIYAASSSGAEVFQGTAHVNTFVISSLATGTAACPTVDSSADANGYDGLVPVLTDPSQAGYVKRLNAVFNTATPGSEFQAAFQAMWGLNRADPDEIWTYAGARVALSSLLTGSSTTGYRVNIDADGTNGHHLGTIVTGVQNEVTGKVVDLNVHPFMPAGVALIRSRTLPVPDSEVSNTNEVVNVQDYMAVEWPNVQMTYDVSTYQMGVLVHYAPAWSGSLVGIAN